MSDTAPTVAVIGAGGIGSLFAARIAAIGARVVVCVRRPFTDLVVTELDGSTRTLPVEVASDAAGVDPVDWILLATKAHQTAGAEPWLRALRGPHTRVAVLQNGVEHVERVRPFVGDATVVPVVVHPAAVATDPGRVRVTFAARSFSPPGAMGPIWPRSSARVTVRSIRWTTSPSRPGGSWPTTSRRRQSPRRCW
jgi:2-dehydropantoate 2-reductase